MIYWYNEAMPKKGSAPLEGEILQGTLDLLVLKTLALGPAHGHTIAHVIEQRSDEVLQVEHGSLYPALPRLAGPAPAGGPRLDRVLRGPPREHPPRALLPAEPRRPQAARRADEPLGR